MKSLLEEFVCALSDIERKKLRPLQFRGAKRKIFLKILKCQGHRGIDASGIVKSYKLSQERYYQLLSEMLLACYYDVAPRGGLELLQYLGNKQLFRHLHKELRRQEAVLVRKGNNNALEQYYFKVILMRAFFMIPVRGNEKILNEFRSYSPKYIHVKKSPHHDDKYLLRLLEIDKEIENDLLLKLDRQKIMLRIRELEAIFLKIKDGDNALVKFRINYALMNYFARIFMDSAKTEEYFAYGKIIMDAHSKQLESVRRLFELDGELEIACLITKNYSIDRYKNYFDEKHLWGTGFPLSYMYRFFPLILDAGDYSMARRYIRKYFPHNLDLIWNDIATYYWTLHMLYYLYIGNYKESEACMKKAFETNTGKSRSIDFEMNLRSFDTFFAALKEDPVSTEERINRHMRYADAHGFQYEHFLPPVAKLIKCLDGKQKQAPEARTQFLQSHPSAQHILMYDKIYAKYFRLAS